MIEAKERLDRARTEIALASLPDWPKNERGHFICTKQRPMPKGAGGRWEHDIVKETDADSDYYIEWKCQSCGHVWRTEMPD
jgi:hypothetical protein